MRQSIHVAARFAICSARQIGRLIGGWAMGGHNTVERIRYGIAISMENPHHFAKVFASSTEFAERIGFVV